MIQYHGLPIGVKVISGEYTGRTGVVTGSIPRYLKGEKQTLRVQLDGFGKPGGWDGKITCHPDQLEACADAGKDQPPYNRNTDASRLPFQ